jgi:hypothetical protein
MTTTMDLSGKSMSELLELYNNKADLMDRPKVKRFSDRKTAEKRVEQITNAIGGVASAGKSNGHAVEPKAAEPVKPPVKVAKPKSSEQREDGALVGKGSYRDKLLNYLQAEHRLNVQHPISELLIAVYGEDRKDFKGPLMMVMKGLKAVLADNRTGLEIRKTRENKENYFGLHEQQKNRTGN